MAIPPVRDLPSLDAEVDSLWVNVRQLHEAVRRLQELEDTMDTPMWKRAVFVLDGWPLFRVVERPQWRPWRRWWTS